MKEKVSIQFTLSDLTLKMVKRYESSGYTNELVRIAKKNATYIKSII